MQKQHKTKATFSRLLRHTAWKRSGAVGINGRFWTTSGYLLPVCLKLGMINLKKLVMVDF